MLIALLCSCSEPEGETAPPSNIDGSPSMHLSHPPLWPPLPRDEAFARALISRSSSSSATSVKRRLLSLSVILELIDEGWPEKLAVGRSQIFKRIDTAIDTWRSEGHPVFILVGNSHDSPGQLRFFQSMLGPGGVKGISLVALEQLAADGQWRGVSPLLQRGDSQALSRFLKSNDPDAFSELRAAQNARNYTGWRYDYIHDLLSLIITSRGADLDVVGCDMPPELQAALELPQEQRDRLRELHCLFSLRGAMTREASAALVYWGDDHLSDVGFPRFLSEDDRLIALSLIGFRSNPDSLEGELSSRLIVNDPILIIERESPMRALLIIGGDHLQGDVERSRLGLPASNHHVTTTSLTISSTTQGSIAIGGIARPISPETSTTIDVPALSSPYLFRSGDLAIIGTIDLEGFPQAQLGFDPVGRRTRIILFPEAEPERDTSEESPLIF